MDLLNPNELVNLFKKTCHGSYDEMKYTSHDYTDREYPHNSHSEGSIWAHTCCVTTNLINRLYPLGLLSNELLLAGLLHDLAKPVCKISDEIIKKNKFLGHPNIASLIVFDILDKLNLTDTDLNIRRIIELINLHMLFKFDIGKNENNTFTLTDKEETLIKSRFSKDKELLRELMELTICDEIGRLTSYSKYNLAYSRYNKLKEIYEALSNFKDNESSVKKEHVLYMLIGLPCSGKTHYRSILNEDHSKVEISRDDIVEEIAEEYNLSYNKVYYNKDLSDQIDKEFNQRLTNEVINKKLDVIIDMTNLSRKTRNKRLCRFSSSLYEKKAIVFIRRIEDILTINDERKSIDKYIHESTFESMCSSFDVPLYDEFDSIEYVFTPKITEPKVLD